jgi:hypothetical protein
LQEGSVVVLVLLLANGGLALAVHHDLEVGRVVRVGAAVAVLALQLERRPSQLEAGAMAVDVAVIQPPGPRMPVTALNPRQQRLDPGP